MPVKLVFGLIALTLVAVVIVAGAWLSPPVLEADEPSTRSDRKKSPLQSPSPVASGTPKSQSSRGSTDLTAFISSHCVSCHSGDTPAGALDLNLKTIQLSDAEQRRRWSYLHDRVSKGEMPPAEADQPTIATREKFLTSLGQSLTQADLKEREVVLRRLNRNEYTNTVRDLFGIHVDLSRLLVDDSVENGFDNTGSKLSVSAEQMELYVEAADVVLDQVFGIGKPTKPVHKTTNLATDPRGSAGSSERKLADGVILFSGAKHLPLYSISAPAPGLYRVRIQVRAEQTKTPIIMQINGGSTGRIAAHTVGFYEVHPGKNTTIEFTDRALEQWDTFSISLVDGYPYWSVNSKTYTGPGLFVGDVTLDGPIEESPPRAGKELLATVDPAKGTLQDIQTILERFVPKAFRRSIEDQELLPYVALAKQALDSGRTFKNALRLSLKGILCAPEFLYLEERTTQTGEIDDFAIASRLSYFLWSSMPDDVLLSAAANGELSKPTVLKQQFERMLADAKSQRFVDNFTGQWLRLRDIDFTVPDRRLYPEYSQLLRQSMLDETHAFFREILDHDLSVQNFIDSDFAMLNQPLANFYNIDGVKGLKMQRIKLPADSVRGGVLTQASVLKVSADGTRTSPVLRGVWILNHLFGTPSPPPPPSVAAVQPDVRGATTIREVLEKHRADDSCNRCHRNIDPPGFALERFDVLGAYRDWYRTRDKSGKYVRRKLHPLAASAVQYKQGPDVDASGVMPDGRKFAGIKEYKQLLLADETVMPRSLTRLVMSYSIGRQLGFSDRTEVDRIVKRLKTNNYGLRSLLNEVVLSETFRTP